MVTITFHGHACFSLEADGRRVVVDPFLTGNPAADIPVDRLPKVDAVLLSHGHGDHLGDAIPIAKRDGATVVATFELAAFCASQGAASHAMHIGGGHRFPFGHVMLVPIGDNYTMGIEDAVRAVEFVRPRTVIPMHYNTFDVIRADPGQFKRQ